MRILISIAGSILARMDAVERKSIGDNLVAEITAKPTISYRRLLWRTYLLGEIVGDVEQRKVQQAFEVLCSKFSENRVLSLLNFTGAIKGLLPKLTHEDIAPITRGIIRDMRDPGADLIGDGTALSSLSSKVAPKDITHRCKADKTIVEFRNIFEG